MDDWRLIQTDNPLANGQLTPLSIWFQTGFPLSDLGLWLEGIAWGENPLFYHAVNVALHAVGSVLLWRVLVRLRVRGAWLAALLFAIHPVCVNSVARIAELKNTFSLPFFLVSLLCYFYYEASTLYPHEPSTTRNRRVGPIVYTLSVMAFVLALFAKTSTVMLPLILCACAIWQRRRLSSRDLVHMAPHFVLAISFGLMSIWFQKYQALAGQTLPSSSLLERALIAPRVFFFYLGKALLPLNLSIVYPRWNLDPQSPDAFLPLVFIGVGALLCWQFRQTWGRHVLFGLSCFGILLFPVLGLFDAQYLTRWQVSDHLEYLPLIAVIALMPATIAWTFERLGALRRAVRIKDQAFLGETPAHPTASPTLQSKAYFLGVTTLLVVMFGMTFHRAGVFANEEKLMRDTLRKNPLASEAHDDLGVILAKQNNLAEARREFETAIQTDPDNISAESNLAFLMMLQGQLSDATSRFRLVLKAKPLDAETHLRMADVCGTQQHLRRAHYHLRMALRSKSGIETKLQLAQLCYRMHRFHEAAEAFHQVLQVKPDSTEALNDLAWLLATCGDQKVRDGAEAVRCAKQACRLTEFRQSLFMSTLAAAYAETGRFPQAIGMAEKAMHMQINAGETSLAELNRQLLDQYRAGKAFHEQMISMETDD